MKNCSFSPRPLVRLAIFFSLCLALPATSATADVLKLVIPAVLTGKYWRTPQLIDINAAGAYNPQVAVDGSGNALAVWEQDDNIWANYYSSATKTWGTAQLIESNTGYTESPQVAFDGTGNAIAVWQQYDGTRDNIWANRYLVGSGWQTAQLIETEDLGYAYNPQIAFDGTGNAFAVWYQYDGTRTNIWANRYLTGTGWQTAQLIENNDAGSAGTAQVAIDGAGNAVAVWSQDDGTNDHIWAAWYR